MSTWLPILKGLKDFRYTIVMDPKIGDTFTDWHRVEWVVEERLAYYNKFAKKMMERFREERLKVGVVWEVPAFEVTITKTLFMDEKNHRWFCKVI